MTDTNDYDAKAVDSTDEARADGAVSDADENPFNVVADVEMSEVDRVMQRFDRSVWTPIRILLKDIRGKIGVAIFSVFLLMGTVGVAFYPKPTLNPGNQLLPPLVKPFEFPLGTDSFGRGLLSQIIQGTPSVLLLVASGAVFSVWLGTVIGVVAGYKGGMIDQTLMMITDAMRALPGLPLLLMLVVIISPQNPIIIGLVLSVTRWSGLARNIRAQILPLRETEYVEASRAMNVPTIEIIRDDVLSNLMPYILINFVKSARGVIFAAVGLYYLGVLQASTSNWGVLLQKAYQNKNTLTEVGKMHWLLVPMATIVVFALSLMLIAQAADRVFNPKIRAKHSKYTTTQDAGRE